MESHAIERMYPYMLALSRLVTLDVSLTSLEVLRAEKARKKEIRALLTPQDIRLLVQASGDPDRTIRVYASEFLYDLGDPRSVTSAFETIGSASDDGKYNLILVIQGALPELEASGRQDARSKLQALQPTVGPNTQSRIQQILGGM